MHPYRTTPSPAREPVAERDGTELAMGVLAVVSGIQVVSALLHAGVFSSEALLGGICLYAAVSWLARSHPARARASGNPRRPR